MTDLERLQAFIAPGLARPISAPRPAIKPGRRAKSYTPDDLVGDLTGDELRDLLADAIDRAVRQSMQAAGLSVKVSR